MTSNHTDKPKNDLQAVRGLSQLPGAPTSLEIRESQKFAAPQADAEPDPSLVAIVMAIYKAGLAGYPLDSATGKAEIAIATNALTVWRNKAVATAQVEGILAAQQEILAIGRQLLDLQKSGKVGTKAQLNDLFPKQEIMTVIQDRLVELVHERYKEQEQ